jgi:RNA polymerase sigma-32 factor
LQSGTAFAVPKESQMSLVESRPPSAFPAITEIQSYAPLGRQEEVELATAWRDHADPQAGDKLVRAHLRYVVATASKYRRYGIPLNELIAEGNFGLVHALKKFDPDRGFRFVTYAAYWIRAYVLNHIIRSWSLVGSGSGALRSKMFFRLRREKVRLANLIGDADEAEGQLAEQLNVTRPQLTSMLRRLEGRDVSLDMKVYDDAPVALVDTLVSTSEAQDQTLLEGQTQRHLKTAVQTAVAKLDARERMIVERRMMAEEEDRVSLADLGRLLGVSRERARQLESRAKLKLRAQLASLPEEARPEWLTPTLFATATAA